MSGNPRRGFTLTEMLVVIGVIAAVLAFLFPALSGVLKSGKMTSSLSNMRQIGQMMELYSRDNREAVLPSQFDYAGPQFEYKGKVRSASPNVGGQHEGTWCDILWTLHDELPTTIPDAAYQFDSPDDLFYDADDDFEGNPFRSTARNTMAVAGGTGSLPFGTGADARGKPGYFAANDFFNARPDASGNPNGIGTWYKSGQIKAPTRSVYLVDSFAGEIIEPTDEKWDLDAGTTEVDFRYNDLCLMLFLDGHTQEEGFWGTLPDLEQSRQIRVRNLVGGP